MNEEEHSYQGDQEMPELDRFDSSMAAQPTSTVRESAEAQLPRQNLTQTIICHRISPKKSDDTLIVRKRVVNGPTLIVRPYNPNKEKKYKRLTKSGDCT